MFEPVASLHGPPRESWEEMLIQSNSAVKSFKELGECCLFFLLGLIFCTLGPRFTLSRNAKPLNSIQKRSASDRFEVLVEIEALSSIKFLNKIRIWRKLAN